MHDFLRAHQTSNSGESLQCCQTSGRISLLEFCALLLAECLVQQVHASLIFVDFFQNLPELQSQLPR